MDITNMINNYIRKRPGMYLGSNSITPLIHFLNGYQAAERGLGICSQELFPLPFRYMHEFTSIRLNCHDNLDWCKHILGFCDGDEEKALNKFFELYDEFCQIRMKRYWKAVLSEDNIQWNNSMKGTCRRWWPDGREPIFSDPIAAYVIELTFPAYILAVETADNIRLEQQFFTSAEIAKGRGPIPFGAETYFGQIDQWEEFSAEDITFDKDIDWS